MVVPLPVPLLREKQKGVRSGMNVSGCASSLCRSTHSKACAAFSGFSAYNPVENNSTPTGFEEKKDTAVISGEARALWLQESAVPGSRPAEGHAAEELDGSDQFHEEHAHDHDDDDDHDSQGKKSVKNKDMSREEQQKLRELQQTDRKVRAHEQAHVSASGRIAVSAPSYDYETGPDGKRYAVGGSVNYNVPSTECPREELLLARQLRRMALAPMDPSPKDRAVAAKASAKEARASREVREEKAEERAEETENHEEEATPAAGQANRNETEDRVAAMIIDLVTA